MEVDVVTEIEIACPRAEVAEYASDPDNDRPTRFGDREMGPTFLELDDNIMCVCRG